MPINEKLFNRILLEMIEENPLACRALFRIAEIEFTDRVPTLAVTLTGKRPSLLVNLDFLSKYCRSEIHVKAVVIHEFLHVLLNHTERFKKMTIELNIALDAVINAIIHRTLGPAYSEMMSEFYAEARGCFKLLRPMTEEEKREVYRQPKHSLLSVWKQLYDGKLVADDILEIATLFKKDISESGLSGTVFIGDHSPDRDDSSNISEETREALETTMKSMSGGGIWRNPRDRGIGYSVKVEGLDVKSAEAQRWEREAIAALRKYVTPDPKSRNNEIETDAFQIPILNSSDRRGFLKSIWSPFIPEILWQFEKKKPVGTVQIYLDVSGSMNQEMDALVGLLWRVRKWVRLPFWAFSDIVGPATIKNGKLETSTTGGTSMNAVLEHVAKTKPEKAVIITDGFIEACNRKLLGAVKDQKLHAIISRNGSTNEIIKAGIPFTQLPRYSEK